MLPLNYAFSPSFWVPHTVDLSLEIMRALGVPIPKPEPLPPPPAE